MPGLTPEQREEARNLAAEMEQYPARRLALAAELIQLRRLERQVRRHMRAAHPAVQRELAELRDNRGDVGVLLDGDTGDERLDPDHELLLASTPPRRPR